MYSDILPDQRFPADKLRLKFPPSAIEDKASFVGTDTTTFCPWKGHAQYYTIKLGGE